MAAPLCLNLVKNTPLIVILGATGTGKSKLAIELALKFNGEVINSDSMQVYKELNIATNKVTDAEQKGIRHHLLSYLDPDETSIVSNYRNKALNIINDIVSNDKVPIIVGGTNYYIESVLYNILINEPEDGKSDCETDDSRDEETPAKKAKLYDLREVESKYEDVPNEELYRRLKEVDPERAETVHPNDRRKLTRSLTVFETHGETYSSLIKKQKSLPGGSISGGPLRFSNALVLWLQCQSEILNERLDARVDEMVSQGLLDELQSFYELFDEGNSLGHVPRDYTRGILQAIGFKEFRGYLELDKEKRKSDEGVKLLAEGVELLKIATKQYARRQIRWVRNRLIRHDGRQFLPVYALDSTDIAKWKENVYDNAEHLVECHLAGVTSDRIKPLPQVGERIVISKSYYCEVCSKTIVGSQQWESHIRGNKHKRTLQRKKRFKEEEMARQKSSNAEIVPDA